MGFKTSIQGLDPRPCCATQRLCPQVERNINAVHRDHMAGVEDALAAARKEVADRDAKLAQVKSLERVILCA